MIAPRTAPPGAYNDDPAEKIDLDHADAAESQRNLAFAIASEGLKVVADWLTHGRNGLKQRAMRADIFLLCVHPDFLPFERRPSAAAVGRLHGVSRETARKLRNQFRDAIAPYIKFPGQRSRPEPHACSERRGRVRRGKRGPQPGPVAANSLTLHRSGAEGTAALYNPLAPYQI